MQHKLVHVVLAVVLAAILAAGCGRTQAVPTATAAPSPTPTETGYPRAREIDAVIRGRWLAV